MAVLNLFAELFNLIPLPPLDGFGIIEHKLDPELRWKLRQPQVAMGCLAVLFIVLWNVPQAMTPFVWMLENVCRALGLPVDVLLRGYNVVMFDTEL
jgi:Zn-dependent protease